METSQSVSWMPWAQCVTGCAIFVVVVSVMCVCRRESVEVRGYLLDVIFLLPFRFWYWIQVIGLGDQHLYLLSSLSGPEYEIEKKAGKWVHLLSPRRANRPGNRLYGPGAGGDRPKERDQDCCTELQSGDTGLCSSVKDTVVMVCKT